MELAFHISQRRSRNMIEAICCSARQFTFITPFFFFFYAYLNILSCLSLFSVCTSPFALLSIYCLHKWKPRDSSSRAFSRGNEEPPHKVEEGRVYLTHCRAVNQPLSFKRAAVTSLHTPDRISCHIPLKMEDVFNRRGRCVSERVMAMLLYVSCRDGFKGSHWNSKRDILSATDGTVHTAIAYISPDWDDYSGCGRWLQQPCFDRLGGQWQCVLTHTRTHRGDGQARDRSDAIRLLSRQRLFAFHCRKWLTFTAS